MVDEVGIALISSGSVLAGIFISQIFEYLRHKSEEKRWFAEHYIISKSNALKNLHLQITKCFNMFDLYKMAISLAEKEYSTKIRPIFDDYVFAYTISLVYMDFDAKENTIFKEIFQFFSNAHLNIVERKTKVFKPPVHKVSKKDQRGYEYAIIKSGDLRKREIERMRELLDPEKIKKYVEKI